MNPEVTAFIEGMQHSWQVEVSNQLRQMVHQSIPDLEERVQYKKPHFLKKGKYAAVISPSKDAIAFMIMNANGLELPEGQFEGPPERKWIKIREGQTPDYELLSKLLIQASSTL
ncbi:DUF1801 domain-containing protein [Paenibacillus sp. Marseille-P2973]|uniref:DUF1801 domain-containing protein n=1 Tax=Paenibacillus sp. Marseille-P2973 TaxID=1871032 RepID=UPI001B36C1E5|nr:DUF1801 domain-containing protein [Paenibacillus sp. Marseille-P2973]MBQ4899096.1 DUF1801 domain-containing protein [Paenibacillus sp. Marseille-P2973]